MSAKSKIISLGRVASGVLLPDDQIQVMQHLVRVLNGLLVYSYPSCLDVLTVE